MRKGAKTNSALVLRRRMTDAERRLWYHLRDHRLPGFKFRRQHPIGPYIVDFVCLDIGLSWNWMVASMPPTPAIRFVKPS